VAAVVIGDALYHYTMIRSRLVLLVTPSRAISVPCVIAAVSILYHRITVPFRRKVIFGV
jgi:hypothetical protein